MERIQENWRKLISAIIGATLIPFLIAELRLPYIRKFQPWVEQTSYNTSEINALLSLAFGIFCSAVLFLIYFLLRSKYPIISLGILFGAIVTVILFIGFASTPFLGYFIPHG